MCFIYVCISANFNSIPVQELDRHSEALPTLQDALRHLEAAQPPAVRARLHFAVAQSAVAAHLPHLLRDALSKARINGQDPASVYNLRGMLCRKERRFQKALRYLSMAIASAPRIARLYYDRAQCYIDMALWPEVCMYAWTRSMCSSLPVVACFGTC